MGVVPVLVRARPQKAVLQVGGRVARGVLIDVVVLWVGGHELRGFSCIGITANSSITFTRDS